MRNGVNKISEGIFEIKEKKKLFLNLRKKNSKILQYCNYILLKEKEEQFKKSILDNLQIFHKKLSFFPITTNKINTERKYFHNNEYNILNKRSFSNRQYKNTYKNISFSNYNFNKNLKLEKLRYNSANNKTLEKNKILKNNSFNNKRLILIPLGLKNIIKNKEINNKILGKKKFNKKFIFKNNNPFYIDNLISPKRKQENDMIFPKRFQKLKKELTDEALKTRDMFIKYEDLIINDK